MSRPLAFFTSVQAVRGELTEAATKSDLEQTKKREETEATTVLSPSEPIFSAIACRADRECGGWSTTMSRLVCCILVLTATCVGQQFVARSYELRVAFDPANGALEGWARLQFRPLPDPPERLVLFLHNELTVKRATVGDDEVRFEQSNVAYRYSYSLKATRIEIPVAGRALSEGVALQYSGRFSPSRARSPSDYMRIDAEGVYLRAYGYSLWFPVTLEAARSSYTVDFTNVRLETPSAFLPVFVGQWIRSGEQDSTVVSEWQANGVDLFDAQCTARPFDRTSKGRFHVYSLRDSGSRSSAKAILDFVERLDGIYRDNFRADAAAGQVHIVQMPKFGDISSGGMVGLSDETWREFKTDDYSMRTMAHEFVHPFVKVAVARSDPLHALAVEGFPSFFHLPSLAEILGQDFYDSTLARTEASYLRRRETGKDSRGGALPPEKALTDMTPDDIGRYKDRFVLNDRALLFLDYLRRKAGLKKFRDLTRDLFNLNRLDRRSLDALVEKHLPGAAADIRLWLNSTEFPERFRRGHK